MVGQPRRPSLRRPSVLCSFQANQATFALLILALLLLPGCLPGSLPFSGPKTGRVVDGATGEPIAGAVVQASWTCHDNPLPDGSGHYNVNAWAVCNQFGYFRLRKPGRRGGWFGTDHSVSVSAKGYIKKVFIVDPSERPLPESTRTYPFVETSVHRSLPAQMTIRLNPAIPVLLKAFKSDNPRYRSIAKRELAKLLKVDLGCDPSRWEAAVAAGEKGPDDRPEHRVSGGSVVCPGNTKDDPEIRFGKCKGGYPDLISAASSGNVEKVRQLVVEGADVDSRKRGCDTALMMAAQTGRPEIVKLLLAAGADVNARNEDCETALMLAAFSGSKEVVNLLLSAGADVNARNKDCETALMKADLMRNREIAEILKGSAAAK
jgi:hypothetical protein